MIRITLLIVIICCFYSFGFSQVKSSEIDKAIEVLKRKGEVAVKIPEMNIEKVIELSKTYSVDNFNNNEITIYINENQLEDFLKNNYKFTVVVPKETATKSKQMAHTIDELTANWDKYPTYDVYISLMQKFATDYPDICKLVDFGNSVENRDLLSVKISDNVETDETEPEFFYTSTMHGDETTGFVLMLHLIDYLLSNYATKPEVKDLIDNIEIWINPVSNPDGTYNSGNDTVCYQCSSRSNANGVDLNRDYTTPDAVENPDVWEKENVDMIGFMKQHNFIMSMNFHGGAEVMNYPWDHTYTRHADDDWFIFVCREYADTVHLYGPAGYLDDESNGITNGADWYPINGSRQDYITYYLHGREVTGEISNSKCPDANSMDEFWDYNYRSLLNYMKQVSYGIHGVVTNALTGNPIEAEIFVENYDSYNSQVYSDPENGDYHRLLKAGTYTIIYSAVGYVQVSSTVTVNDYETLTYNVQLIPEDYENKPPVFLNKQNEPIDTIYYNLLVDSILNITYSLYDENGDSIYLSTYNSVTANATLSKVNDTSIIVSPNNGFAGIEEILLVITDNGFPNLSDSLHVIINYVKPVNHAPQIVDDSGQSIDTLYYNIFRDSSLNIKLNGIDIDNHNIDIFSVISINNLGEIVLEPINDTSFIYNPESGYTGVDILKVKVADDGDPVLYDSVFVEITIINYGDNPPVIVDDNSIPVDTIKYYTFQDSAIDKCLNVTDVDNDEVIIISGESLAGNGEVTLLTSDNHCFKYLPDEAFIGNDTLKIVMVDNSEFELMDSVIVTIEIKEKGNNPPAIVDENNQETDSLYFYRDTYESFDISINIVDIDNDPVSICSVISINNVGSSQVSGTTLTSFIYEPEIDYVGYDTLKVIVCDNSYYDLKDSVIVVIEIIEIDPEFNNPPVILDELGNEIDTSYIGIYSDSTAVICLIADDPDGDNVLISEIIDESENGIFNLMQNPLCFSYTPITGFEGIHNYSVVVCDDNDDPKCDTLVISATVVKYVTVYSINNNVIKLYPNPFTDYITVDKSSYENSQAIISIIDLYGRKVFEGVLQLQNHKIQTNSLKPGIYFVVIVNKSNVYKFKMIKVN